MKDLALYDIKMEYYTKIIKTGYWHGKEQKDEWRRETQI